jgi:glycosidase
MRKHFQIVILILTAVFCQVPTHAKPLSIDKVEPPNWWVPMKHNRVQLMLYGDNLKEIEAKFDNPQLKVSAIHTLANPAYAFVDIEIPPDLAPGIYVLSISKEQETIEVKYPILSRNSDKNRYAGFGPRDIVYLITPDRFANGDPFNDRKEDRFGEFDQRDPYKRHGGDLQGIIDHLDYLKDLGVTALWLNPVLENNGRLSYHGYQTTDYYRIDPRFGSNDDYRRLVQAAHERGLKIIFDHINNHIGINHPWIKNLPADDWLNGSVENHLSDKHYKFSVFDTHADDKARQMLRTFWFVDEMPDLNQKNPFLATYLIQNTLWWIEFSGMDGIREDTYPYPDPAFLSEWERVILTEYPQFNIVGEIYSNSSALISRFQKGTVFSRPFETNLPAVMDFPLMMAYRDFIQGKGTLKDIYEVFAVDFLYGDPDNLLTFLDNHDTPRAFYIAKERSDRVKLCLAMLLTTRGIPQLLYGTEIGMLGGEKHVELRADFPGGFPDDKRSAFAPAGRTEKENEVFDYVQTLLHLRKQHPALSIGDMTHMVPKDEVYMYFRTWKEECIWIVVNGNEQEKLIDFSETAHWFEGVKKFRNLLSDKEITFYNEMDLKLAGMQVGIFKLKKSF